MEFINFKSSLEMIIIFTPSHHLCPKLNMNYVFARTNFRIEKFSNILINFSYLSVVFSIFALQIRLWKENKLQRQFSICKIHKNVWHSMPKKSFSFYTNFFSAFFIFLEINIFVSSSYQKIYEKNGKRFLTDKKEFSIANFCYYKGRKESLKISETQFRESWLENTKWHRQKRNKI